MNRRNPVARFYETIYNAPTHPNAEELKSGEVKTMFLPPAVTSLIQPVDQGVLENLKCNYRRLLFGAYFRRKMLFIGYHQPGIE
ncbi:jerky protein homolog-like isoform X2 [Euwallacea fornicatus]|uniref:jerky protein homolog-like isoform X2 n=1 Tax=Euwallacea fornicatus TaxID=995702 RepID=UPI00338DB38A